MIKDRANQEINPFSVVSYLGSGMKLALSKECRLFVIIPIIINFIVLLAGGYFAVQMIHSVLQEYLGMLPQWLSFLSYLLWVLLAATMGFIFVYIFNWYIVCFS